MESSPRLSIARPATPWYMAKWTTSSRSQSESSEPKGGPEIGGWAEMAATTVRRACSDQLQFPPSLGGGGQRKLRGWGLACRIVA